MTESTLGIVSLSLKRRVTTLIKDNSDLKVIFEKQFDLTKEQASKDLKKEIQKDLIPVYAFILEGSNAIKDWLAIKKIVAEKTTSFIYASSTIENANLETVWLKSLSKQALKKHTLLTKPKTATNSNSKPTLSAQTKTTVVKNKTTPTQNKTLSTTMQMKKSVANQKTVTTETKSTVNQASRLKKPKVIITDDKKPSPIVHRKALTTTNRGGVTKPPISALTGRSRKVSRLTEKRPTKNDLKEQEKVERVAEISSTTQDEGIDLSPAEPLSQEDTSLDRPEEGSTLDEAIEVDDALNKIENDVKEDQSLVSKEPKVQVEFERSTEPKLSVPQSDVLTLPIDESDVTSEDEVELVQSLSKDETESANEHSLSEDETESSKEQSLSEDNTTHQDQTSFIEQDIKELDITTHEEERQEIQVPLYVLPHPSTCSLDEHDAEVFAATSRLNNDTLPLLSQSGRSSSFSPLSNLARPITPEIDQIRLKFETIIQTSTPESRRPSKGSPDIRIKDMKPRGPVGARVKSMVKLFMDENLNKWEF